MVYIQMQLILQTAYVLKSSNSSKISAVYNQERFQIKSGFKSRAGYNGARTVDIMQLFSLEFSIIMFCNKAAKY